MVGCADGRAHAASPIVNLHGARCPAREADHTDDEQREGLKARALSHCKILHEPPPGALTPPAAPPPPPPVLN